jgi:hypothetical protein
MAWGNMTQQQVQYGYASDQQMRERQRQAQLQAQAAEQRRLEQQGWERQRTLNQEGLLQQEQSRRGTETKRKYDNEELGIRKNHKLGMYGEDTKRRGQRYDFEKSRMDNDTSRYGMDKISGMFGTGNPSSSISLYDSGGSRIGGTMSQGGGIGSRPYQTQNFGLRSSLLAPRG